MADNIVRQTEDALAEEVRPFAEMLVEQRRARRLEEDQAAARNRRRLVEPEGPVRQARTRIDQEGMILAEGRQRRPGEWQGKDPGQEKAEERRGGEEGVSKGRTRWSQYTKKKNK